MDRVDPGVIVRMLANPNEQTGVLFDREKITCGPGELRNAIARIDALLSGIPEGCRIALFSDDEAERRMIAAGITARSVALHLNTKLVHGEWGKWAHSMRKNRNSSSIHVLTDVPPKAKAREGFEAVAGGLILLWPLEYAGTAVVPDQIEELLLSQFAERPLDKAAHLVVAAVEELGAMERIAEDPDPRAMLPRIDAGAIATICVDPAKLRTVADARAAGAKLAEVLRTHVALTSDAPLGPAEIFAAIFPNAEYVPPNIRRLWVEGESDAALFRLADTLLAREGLLQGIKIEVLGGASQVEGALLRCNRPRHLELFLFDADADGRRAAAKADNAGFPSVILDRGAVMAAVNDEWVVEDLLSVACLDRFYKVHSNLRPAREEIEHHPVSGRRLVVRGEDKHLLVEWLLNNAKTEDIGGVIKQLIIIRRQFSLREPTVSFHSSDENRRGLRPEPWWLI